jgi:hypothetical protein
VLRKIWGLTTDQVTEEWRGLHIEELCDMSCPPNFVWVIKSRGMTWVGHVAHMGDRRAAYSVFVGKPEGKRPIEKVSGNGRIILKRILTRNGSGWRGLD